MRYYFHLRVGQELSPDDLGMELPDLDSAYLEAFQAAQDMWAELLAQRSDPLIRSFEIADSAGRVLLILPFGEVLDRARKRAVPLPEQVRSAQALLEKTRELTDALREKINGSKEIIESARETMRESRTVLQRLSSPREW
jgi:hypothetical protein